MLYFVAHVVEHEELGLRAEKAVSPMPVRLQIGFSAFLAIERGSRP